MDDLVNKEQKNVQWNGYGTVGEKKTNKIKSMAMEQEGQHGRR